MSLVKLFLCWRTRKMLSHFKNEIPNIKHERHIA